MIRFTSSFVFISVLSLGQATGDHPAFEVASIKPTSSTERFSSFSVSGNRLTCTKASLGLLIRYAYDLGLAQIVGGPNWLWSEQQQYDVMGKAEGEAKRTPAELKLMLQALLADRFKLAVHDETRDISVFALVVAKKGPKLGEAKPPDGQPDRAYRGAPGHIIAQKTSMARFASGLPAVAPELRSQMLLDETGLSGEYAFTLDWVPDEIRALRRDGDSDRPSLFGALEEQLGLRLETVKRPIDHLIIDHAEKPSEN